MMLPCGRYCNAWDASLLVSSTIDTSQKIISRYFTFTAYLENHLKAGDKNIVTCSFIQTCLDNKVSGNREVDFRIF